MSPRSFEIIAVAFGALLIAAFLTGLVRKVALSRGLLDVPNERSSHTAPTPRGGGVSIVVAVNVMLIFTVLSGALPLDVFFALFGGGVAVALIGFMDDRQALPARVRLGVHVAAAVWAVAWLGGLPRLGVAGLVLELGWVGNVLAVLGIVWALNLFNFMDGIDGIAASEAVFIAVGGASVMLSVGHGGALAAVGAALGAACAGFLLWNWPPAKIFMGDVGSGYLGYMIGVLALATSSQRPADFWVWLILAGAFFVDATLTLLRRLARGERVYQAHRTHAYQWLARRWGSHLRVTLSVLTVDLFWLLPCAFLASIYPRNAPWIALVALTPLVVLAAVAGAGRCERSA